MVGHGSPTFNDVHSFGLVTRVLKLINKSFKVGAYPVKGGYRHGGPPTVKFHFKMD